MQYLLGVDIGTTAVKSVAFDTRGNVLHSFAIDYQMHHPAEDESEQDPDEIFEAVMCSIEQVVNTIQGAPLFVSFCAAMHSLLAVDKNGLPLTKLIIWADNRAKNIADNLRNTEDGKQYYQQTGVPVHAMSPFCKLLWLKQQRQELYADAFKFCGIKSYVFYRLFNRFVTDSSVASASGLLNLNTLTWDQQILDLLELSVEKLPQVVAPVTVFTYDADKTGYAFLHNTPIVIGASDGATANLGTGAREDIMAVTIGTSGAARMLVHMPVLDHAMRSFCYHVNNNQYIIGGGNNNGAVVLQWLKQELLASGEDNDNFFALAGTIPAGANELLMLPYILGERAPLWNADAKAVFFGLTKNHRKAHMVRAAMEGVIFAIYSIAKVLMEKHRVSAVHASGGFTKSEIWLQMLADIMDVPVHVSGAREASALGAVMLGAGALNIENKFENRVTAGFYPIEKNVVLYRQNFAKFERLYALLKDEM